MSSHTLKMTALVFASVAAAMTALDINVWWNGGSG